MLSIKKGVIYTELVGEIDDVELYHLDKFLTFDTKNNTVYKFLNNNKLYTGLIPFLKDSGFSFNDPNTIEITPCKIDKDILNNISLIDYQASATRKALSHRRGVIQSPTGSGKTAMAAALIAHARRDRVTFNVTVLVPSIFLMEQMSDALESYGLGKVIRVSGNRKLKFDSNDYNIAVCVVNSAYRAIIRDTELSSYIKNSDMVIIDEAHHTKSESWEKVLIHCEAEYRIAYTATVFDDPSKISYGDLILIGLTGKIIFHLSSKSLRNRGYLADPLVTIIENKPKMKIPAWSWQNVYKKGIVGNKARNKKIVDLATEIYSKNNKIMVFIGHIKHGHTVAKAIANNGCDTIFVHGGSTVYFYNSLGSFVVKRLSIDDIGNYINSKESIVLVTTSVLDEGVDIPVINVLIMGTGMEKYRRTVQRCGRGMRPKKADNRVFIFDFYDMNHNFLEKHSKYRIWTYEEEEFDISYNLEDTLKMIGITET